MKKILKNILSLVLIVFLVSGCNSDNNYEIDKKQKSKETEIVKDITKDNYVASTLTETGFISEWFGLTYSAPEPMKFSEKEDLLVMTNENVSTREEKGDQATDYEKIERSYEFVGFSEDGMILTVEVTDSSSDVDENMYLDSIKNKIDLYTTPVTYCDTTSRDIGGEQYIELSFLLQSNEVTVFHTILLRSFKGRTMVIIMIYTDELLLDSHLTAFKHN